jgi:hypothetical protein
MIMSQEKINQTKYQLHQIVDSFNGENEGIILAGVKSAMETFLYRCGKNNI